MSIKFDNERTYANIINVNRVREKLMFIVSYGYSANKGFIESFGRSPNVSLRSHEMTSSDKYPVSCGPMIKSMRNGLCIHFLCILTLIINSCS